MESNKRGRDEAKVFRVKSMCVRVRVRACVCLHAYLYDTSDMYIVHTSGAQTG